MTHVYVLNDFDQSFIGYHAFSTPEKALSVWRKLMYKDTTMVAQPHGGYTFHVPMRFAPVAMLRRSRIH